MKKACFFDVDGTLWDYRNFIPDSTREAMRLLKQNGVLTFINTGRAMGFLQNEDLFSLDFDGVVAACGTHIRMGDQDLYHYLMDQQSISDALDLTSKYHFRTILEGPDTLYLQRDEFQGDMYGDKVIREMGDLLLDISENAMNWRANKFSCDMTKASQEEIDECLELLSPNFELIIHGGFVSEMVPRGHSKGTGVLKVCELLDIDVANTYAFGDSANDLTMLEMAGHSIVMGSGVESVKEVAEFVTTPLLEDGIYNACKHFELI